MALTPGALLNNRYRIDSILGQGGMGAVYRATDELLNIPVAVKENLFLAEEYTRQFQREASILASLRHPNLPRVGDYCSIPGQGQYLIMDYIEGEDLRQRIERLGALPEREVILVGVMICDALTYLHTRQPPIIHRDLKPGNIKISPEGEVYLVDFGLAKVSEGAQATTTGARAMTPGYSPPEQYGTARTDARSDIYSLSATLYAALTGAIPEDGLGRITGKSQLTPVRRLQPGVNRRLSATIEKALAVDSDNRYQTADEFKAALLESGEMTHLIKPRPTVQPPPDGAYERVLTSHQMNNSSSREMPSASQISAGLRRRRSFGKFIWVPFALIIILAGLFLSRNLFIISDPGHGALVSITSTLPAEVTPTQINGTPAVTQTLHAGNQGVLSIPTLTPYKLPVPSLTATSHPVPEKTPLGGGFEQITFASNRSGSMQLWTMNTNGTLQRQLTTINGGACQPDWSHDGSQLAFISPCSSKSTTYEGSKIYIMNADGTDIHLMPVTQNPAGDYDPAWSPDGKRIAFTSMRTGTRHIFVLDLETQRLDELSNTPFPDKQPAWSPGGKQLAFSRVESVSKIWIVNDNGSSSSLFTLSGYVNNQWPAWSNDGEYLVYSQTEAKGSIPWLVKLRYEDRGTAREKRVIPAGWDKSFPVADVDISPDSNWFVFESWPDGRNHDIYMMDQNGENLIRLTTDPDFDFTPSWRPITTK